ncbi:MAG: PAAR-like protein, partial [Planctomycetia bacterium]
MPEQIATMFALCSCDMGASPTPLVVTSQFAVTISGLPAATIADCLPITNIVPFITCKVLTAAALGVPTPCVPAPVGSWMP